MVNELREMVTSNCLPIEGNIFLHFCGVAAGVWIDNDSCRNVKLIACP